MIDALFSQTNYTAAKKLLDASTLRHEAIASNLANLETPNYQRVDLAPSFKDELRQALATNDPQRINQVQPQLAQDLNAVSNRRDGNNVQLENELLQLNQNSLEHSFEVQLISGTLAKLRTAITGKVS